MAILVKDIKPTNDSEKILPESSEKTDTVGVDDGADSVNVTLEPTIEQPVELLQAVDEEVTESTPSISE